MDEDPSTFLFELLIIGVCIVFSAFFSGMEIAFISSDKAQFKNNFLKIISKNSSRFIVSMVIGNNVSLVIYSIYTSKFIGRWVVDINFFSSYPLALLFITTIISTFFILLLAEFTPKVFFNLYAHQILKKMMIPASFFYGIFYIPTLLITAISNAILRIFNQVNKQPKFLKQYNRANAFKGVNAPLKNFNPLNIIHSHTSFTAINLEKPEKIDALQNIKKGGSKILVYEKTGNHIIGYIKAVHLFKQTKNLSEILLPVVKIKNSASITNTLSIMKENKNALVIIYDEKEKFCGVLKKETVIEMFLQA